MLIDPMPPVATGVTMPWDADVPDPVEALARARDEHGDTFVVDSAGDRYLFTFSPAGVASFYSLGEGDASKGVADWRMLRRKIPDEVFQGRRTFPHELFTRDDAASHLLGLEKALDETRQELGGGGEVDVFALTRRLGHRMGWPRGAVPVPPVLLYSIVWSPTSMRSTAPSRSSTRPPCELWPSRGTKRNGPPWPTSPPSSAR
jgi:hypothetical protein